MARSTHPGSILKSVLSHAVLIGLSIIFAIPFVWLVSTSLRSEPHMSTIQPEWIPRAEYVQADDGTWSEVIAREVTAYAPVEYDADGRPLPRQALQYRVTLADRWGHPRPQACIVEQSQIFTKPWPTWRHYVQGIKAFRFDLFLQNTLFIATITVVGTVLSCSWVAFGFSILRWPGRDKVFYVMLATLMLPPQVTMIPLFLIFKDLGWVNSYKPLLVPAFLGNAFFIFLLRQFFLTIPRDLIDAARVDGCSPLRLYWQIVLPLSKPALATVALFTFIASWNDFMGPLIYVVDETRYTLSLGLAMFKGRFATRYGEMMAVSTMLTLPIIVLFFFTQKTFIQGIKTTGLKG